MRASKNLLLIISLFTLFTTTLLLSGCILPKTTMVPMRDGTKLATDVYVKHGQQPHGTVLIRTPYNKSTWDARMLGNNFAKNGWPMVIQDMRGRYASEGNDTVFRNEYTDGPDTIAWVANQSFSNGKIVTFGGSALGITQYLTAGANPAHLACQYIQVATPNLYTWCMYQGGQFRQNLVVPWLQGQGSTYILPDIYLHENSSDPYWQNVSIATEFSNVNVPAIHIGGWYDIFTQGIIDGWTGYQHHGGPGAIGKSKLILGPWTHGGMGSTTQGQLTYPKASVDNFSQSLFWSMVNQYTQGIPSGYDGYPNVTYYVMGDPENPDSAGNLWRQTADWPPASTPVSWYLQANQSLLQTPSQGGSPITYVYNPKFPVPTYGGQELVGNAGPYDQRPVENRSDVLVFTSPPLNHHFEATGRIHAILYVSSDCLDTDFTVKMTDVYPDGRSMLICDGILRMRDRNGSDHWEFMEPGTVYRIDVDLMSTSYVWDLGHEIRVDISSSNSPRFLANPNTADGIARNTTSVIAHNSLYLDAEHPSCLVLPWMDLCNDSGRPPVVMPMSRSLLLDKLAMHSWWDLIPRQGV